MGLFQIFAKPLAMLLSWLYGLVQNYGLSLIIITVVVKICLYPLYEKQMKSSMKMSEIQPQIKELQQKYANDRATMQEKVMELQKQEGASATGGCLPMLVQMLVIFGLFALLRNPMTYFQGDGDMLFAIHEPFLWIKDLAQPDKWVLPILSGIATFIASSLNQTTTDVSGNAQQAAFMTKYMKYVFPVMILWLARTYPAGLAIYWFGSQAMQIFFNLRFNKVKKKMQEQKKAAKKKKVKA